MKGPIKYIAVGGVLFVMLLSMELFFPKPVSWLTTLSSNDKIPYGTYVLKESLPDLFENTEMSRLSFYEMPDSLQSSFLLLSVGFDPGKVEYSSIMKKIQEGNSVLIASENFGNFFLDTLEISIDEVALETYKETGNPIEDDSLRLDLIFDEKVEKFWYKAKDVSKGFKQGLSGNWEVLVLNAGKNPIVISKHYGKGKLVLCSAPKIFTNYYLLKSNNHLIASATLSLLPFGPLHWSEFYSRGRGEPLTPLRYVLATPPLKWAYYCTILGLLMVVIFEARRKQRPIPVLTSPKNESLNFVKTVGNLYFEKSDHKNIAQKRINYILEYIRNVYHIPTNNIDDKFFHILSHKSGKPLINVEGLFTMISILQDKHKIDEEELMVLNKKIEAFLE